MLSRNRLLIHVALAVAAASPLIASAEKGDWLVRAGVHQLNPDKTNLPNALGGDLVFDKGEAFGLNATYMLTDHLGTDLFVPTYFSLDIQRKRVVVGDERIGETDLWAPILGLQWHFNIDGAIRPYIGLGVNWSNFSGEEIFGGGVPANSRLEIDQAFGPAGRIGVDIGTSEHWFLNFDVRYVELQTDIELQVPGHRGRHHGRQGRLPAVPDAEAAVRLRQCRTPARVDQRARAAGEVHGRRAVRDCTGRGPH